MKNRMKKMVTWNVHLSSLADLFVVDMSLDKYMRNKKSFFRSFCLFLSNITLNDEGKLSAKAAVGTLHIIFYIILFNLIKNIL